MQRTTNTTSNTNTKTTKLQINTKQQHTGEYTMEQQPTTTEQIAKQIEETNKKLDEKKTLNWLEKIAIKKFIKQNKRLLQKETERAQQNKQTEKELNQKITEAILQMKEHFDIQVETYDEQQKPIKDKKGNPIQKEATIETLQNMPLQRKIETFEQILQETQKII